MYGTPHSDHTGEATRLWRVPRRISRVKTTRTAWRFIDDLRQDHVIYLVFKCFLLLRALERDISLLYVLSY